MTVPNAITIGRLGLIPVFVVFVWLFHRHHAEEGANTYRVLALAVFFLAAISDAVDGFIARRYHQSSALGRVLDPVADKLLMLAAIVMLSLTQWTPSLPTWFAAIVVTRDALIVAVVILLYFHNGSVRIAPTMASKWCTAFEFATVTWVLLDFWSENRPLVLELLIAGATLFNLISAGQYAVEGVRQYRHGPAEDKAAGTP